VGAGSDVAAIKTTAERQGEEYVINGGKMWTTNGTQADWMCLLANTGDGPAHANKSLICVPMDAPGVSVAPRFDKLGMRSSDTTQVRGAGGNVSQLATTVARHEEGLTTVHALPCRCFWRMFGCQLRTSLERRARGSSTR